MGVYLPNAKMPIGCFGCWVPKELCGLTINGTLNRRHIDCPLVEVKKHGRLIDGDALLKDMECITNDEICPLHIAARIDQYIETAPTVIDAGE